MCIVHECSISHIMVPSLKIIETPLNVNFVNILAIPVHAMPPTILIILEERYRGHSGCVISDSLPQLTLDTS